MTPARRVCRATLAALAIAGLAACGDSGSSTDLSEGGASSGSTSGGAAPTQVQTVIDKVAFADKEIAVAAGGVVVFDNKDTQPHTATADDSSFDTGLIPAGAVKELSFAKPGTYAFHCSLHPFMTARVVVS